MKIFSWNVNGLRSVIKKNFYEFLEDYDIDVLCLQETRITEKDLAKVELNFKYKIFNFAEKAGYSGTCIMSQVDLALPTLTCQSRTVQMTLESFVSERITNKATSYNLLHHSMP